MSVLNNCEFLLFFVSVQVADLGWTHSKHRYQKKPLKIIILMSLTSCKCFKLMKMAWYYRKNCNLLLLRSFFSPFKHLSLVLVLLEWKNHICFVVCFGLFGLLFLILYSCGCCRLLNPNFILQYMFHTNNEFVSLFVLTVVSV